jgi:hypothetical protein
LVDLGVLKTVWTSAITPDHPMLAKKLFKNKKFNKTRWKFFPFINYENPLYFWVGKVALEAPSKDHLEA